MLAAGWRPTATVMVIGLLRCLRKQILGHQYITTRSSPDHPVLGPLYKRLLDAGVLKPFTAEIAGPNPYGAASSDVRHFTAPNGLKSVSQYLLESSGVPVDWGVAVDDLTLSEAGDVSVSVKEGSLPADAATASVVVLTQPPPQVLGASKFGMRGSFLQARTRDGLDKPQEGGVLLAVCRGILLRQV